MAWLQFGFGLPLMDTSYRLYSYTGQHLNNF